ncbi:unnamed protein product [Cyprideis torosa]|uniref:Uncharacterized protein n=2 Tax=Cyprideis torosa TaxID=163714 RepID=A0A7R8W5F2_9CRUS|nr:unnamed protein product [Cyprideis torosa]CAG0885210.1 unnamed protein product [Cyprideis torosa]
MSSSRFKQHVPCLDPLIHVDRSFPQQQVKDIEEDFCGMDVNTPLGGETAVEAVPVVTWDRPRVTSVTVTLTSDFTVAFCGTEDGRVKKIVIPNRHAAIEYEDILLDPGSPVQRDAAFDATGEHIYVMTQRRISKVRVQGCERYTKCGDCLGASDPYCGWCSLENRCTKIQDCKNAEKYWVAYKGENCTAIKSVIPNQLQRTTAVKLTLEIENLPLLRAVYQCVFTALGKTLVTEASLEGRNILCETPRTDRLPQIAPEQHHFTAKLAVRVKDGQEFADTDFTFFDCNTYTSCTQCVNSTFPCDWCVDGHRCTHDTAENCRNDVLVTGKERIGPSIRSGPNFCPRIKATSSRKHLVPAGSTRGIRVSVDNIAQFIVQTRFVCQFNVEGRVKSVSASLIGDMVYCDEVQFDYNSPAPNITASFAVIWGSSKTLDNPHNIQVLIYRCRLMANNCGLCLTLAPEYGCGWCQSSARCEIKDHCEMGKGIWLNQGQPCPNPQVTDFTPKYGVWEGKINVTIFGINLGRRFEDVQTGITVAGIPCSPFRETYVVTQSVTCYLDGPGYDSHRKGPVVVKVADFRGESEANFEFVNPRIRGFSPLRGPQSGGTHLTIEGDFMNAGSKIEAFIRNIPCVLVSRRVFAVRKERELESPWFAYVDDPVIISVESGIRGQAKVAKGIPAGGITLNVKGRNLDIIQRPKMYIYYKDRLFEERCQILRADLMECVAPRVDVAPGDRLSADNPAQLEFGFLMDGVESVKNLSSKPGFGKFLLYPNPYFFEFEEKPKHYKSDYLTINGENLDRASHEKDVRVLIGNGVCNVTSLSRSQLTCRPPDAQPAAVDRFGRTVEGALPQVVALVGLNNLSFVIGELSYRPQTAADAALSQTVIIGMSVGGGVILLILFAIAVLYRRKSTENARVLKGMQEQMDVLELKVAAECKEAFAELQTEITDWTSDMTHGGIPFLDYRTYAMKILFPNIEEHPVMTYAMKILFPNIEEHPVMFPDTNGLNYAGKEQGIKQFGQLVLNKTFLLLFIRTLEGNKYFSMRDRVNVASLIMVALQGKMDYCTDVLKTLLADLIERCMNGKSHPKLLLRRTESVAEKMLSAWFTFLLYKFLRECAGEPLFLLYRATKQQVNKGPVDHFTSEARYSLSEEKLIRQSINYQPLFLFTDLRKMSLWGVCVAGSKDELDLEWRTGNHGYGRIVLNDEDSTTKIEQGWKRINTLQHYEVKDGAVFNLVLRQSYPNQNNFNDTLRSHKYETLNLSKGSSPPASRATSPLNHENDNGSRWWHLVKHHDSHNDKDRGNKMVSEIYLTRLLSTKITLQKYVDDLFETIFSIAHRGSALPLAIKYLFDFLDDQAKLYGIMDPEVVHTWKSNSLPLRFWVNLIKNPNFVFDIQKSNIVDSCLSVIAQTFMDSCSTSQHRLGKESPSSKLLYAKDIPAYKDWVERYYHDIQLMPSISEQDMAAMLAEESRGHGGEFNVNAALMELYSYAMTHQEQLRLTLDEDEFSKKQRLSAKLNRVFQLMSAEPTA